MNKKKQKWLTCTPKSFIGSARFFTRDSGLLSEGFRMLGYDVQAIMLGPEREDDDPRILRASMEQLCNEEFWRSLDAEGVVFYGWAMPRYTSICKAIKAAELKLILNLDTGGLLSLRVEGLNYAKVVCRGAVRDKGLILGGLKACASLVRSLIPRAIDIPRLEHMKYADLIGCVSPIAFERLKQFALHYRRDSIAEKLRLIAHPISVHMDYTGEHKDKQICVIGRWSEGDAVKRPLLTLGVLASVLRRSPSYRAVVIGEYDDQFCENWELLDSGVRERIELTGRLSNATAADLIRKSQITFCASESESFHIASAEAMCCGCSVVSYCSPFLPSFDYFISEESGTLAEDNSEQSLVEALLTEINAWNRGQRDASHISRVWSERLHADRVASEILNELNIRDYSISNT